MEIKKTYKKFHKQRRFFMKVLKETIKKGAKLVSTVGLMAGLAMVMPYNVNTVQAEDITRVDLQIVIEAGEGLPENITSLSPDIVTAEPIEWKVWEYRQYGDVYSGEYVPEETGTIAKCDTDYRADVKLIPAEGNQFDYRVATYVNGTILDADQASYNEEDGSISVHYKKKTDTHTDKDEDGICDGCKRIMSVAFTLADPKHGEEFPTAELVKAVEGVEIGEIKWTVDTVVGEVATGKAECNTQYIARVPFLAKDGYEWGTWTATYEPYTDVQLEKGATDTEKIAELTFGQTGEHENEDGDAKCDYCDVTAIKILELEIEEPESGSVLAQTIISELPEGITVTEIQWTGNVGDENKALCDTEYGVSITLEADQKIAFFDYTNLEVMLNGKSIGGSFSKETITLSTAMPKTAYHVDEAEVDSKCDNCGMTKVSKIAVTFESLVAVTGSLPNQVTFDTNVFEYSGNDLLYWYKKEITDDSGEYESVLAKTGVDCGKQYYLKTSELTLTSPTSYYWDNENEVVATVNDVKATIEWQDDGSFIIQSAPICMYHEDADSDGLCGREGCNTIRNINIEVTLTPGEPLGTPVLNDTVSDFQTYSWYIGENGVYDDEKVKCGTTYRLHVFSIRGKKLAESGYSKVDSGTVITVNNMSVPEKNITYNKESEYYTIDYIFDSIPECADTDENGRCDACDELMPGVMESLMGCHLTLNGKIAMNFHMKLDSEIANNRSKLVLTLPDGSITKEMSIDEAEKDGDVYIFSYEVAAKEMTDEITVQMWWDDFPEGKEYTYSVQDYAEAVLNAEEGTYDAETIAFVKAMVNYGAYAQTYFDYNTEYLANDILEDKGLNNLTADTLKNTYQPKKVDNDAVGTFESANLTLKTETSITVKIKLADGVTADNAMFEIGLNGVWDEVEATKQGDYYVFTKENIKPSDLDTVYSFKVTVNGNSATLKYGALSYCYSV